MSDRPKILDHEIEPPWVRYPGYAPGDGFWRQSGETWFMDVWQPFWASLDARRREAYLERWNAPSEWRMYYFDSRFRAWLDSVDDD